MDMPLTDAIEETADILDSRDVIERISDLTEALWYELMLAPIGDPVWAWREDWQDDVAEALSELRDLTALADEASNYAADWDYGEALIRDSYFSEYAQQLADDIGAVDATAGWPTEHVDWDAAARALQMDYTTVTFRGVDYWIR